MGINFYSKRIIQFLGISLFLSFTLFEIGTINKQIKAEKNFIAATQEDLYFYQGVGMAYLCTATRKGYDLDFSKTLDVVTTIFGTVIQQKHGGTISDKNEIQKANLPFLLYQVKLNLIGDALKNCPNNIPEREKKLYEIEMERFKKIQKLEN